MGAPTFKWNMIDRGMLSKSLLEGFSLVQIEEEIGISRFQIKSEIKRGLTEDEYKERRYVKYNPERSVYQTALQAIGEDGMRVLLGSKAMTK